ncbi:MAG: hydroxymethylbilane synthase [Actinomycetota bacterium]|nr:hydroxymethylbilane synthase [Actinomycetota bacterium]
MRVRLATRGSALARWQTDRVIARLEEEVLGTECEVVVVSTTGDRNPDTPIHEMGGQGVFVAEVQTAVLDGRADVAVHSAKDLPATTCEGLTLAAVPERADPRDALVGSRWADLVEGAVIATGSIRRRAHLAHHRPDLEFQELRGNIETRLRRVSDVDAIVMAKAALDRLGLISPNTDPLEPEVLLPQVAQGALAVECRSDDLLIADALSAIEDPIARRTVDAERAFLAEMGAGCNLPVAAYAQSASTNPQGDLIFTGALASLDGTTLLREERSGSDGVALGQEVARHLLDHRGGRDLLLAQ